MTVTGNVAGVPGSVPVILAFAECGTAWMDRPGGRPVALNRRAETMAWYPVRKCVSENAWPARASAVPGSISVTRCLPWSVNAAVPSGVPSPVGPSYPGPPWHRYWRPASHWPLTPEVTWEQVRVPGTDTRPGTCAGVGVPASA